jgi:hypothetical protein
VKVTNGIVNVTSRRARLTNGRGRLTSFVAEVNNADEELTSAFDDLTSRCGCLTKALARLRTMRCVLSPTMPKCSLMRIAPIPTPSTAITSGIRQVCSFEGLPWPLPGDSLQHDTGGEYVGLTFLRGGGLGAVSTLQSEHRRGFTWWRFDAPI